MDPPSCDDYAMSLSSYGSLLRTSDQDSSSIHLQSSVLRDADAMDTGSLLHSPGTFNELLDNSSFFTSSDSFHRLGAEPQKSPRQESNSFASTSSQIGNVNPYAPQSFPSSQENAANRSSQKAEGSVPTISLTDVLFNPGDMVVDRNFNFDAERDLAYPDRAKPNSRHGSEDRKPAGRPSNLFGGNDPMHGRQHQQYQAMSNSWVDNHMSTSLEDLSDLRKELEQALDRALDSQDEEKVQTLMKLIDQQSIPPNCEYAPHQQTQRAAAPGRLDMGYPRLLSNSLARCSPPNTVGENFIKITNGPLSDASSHGFVSEPGPDEKHVIYLLNVQCRLDSVSYFLDFKQDHERFAKAASRDEKETIRGLLANRYRDCIVLTGPPAEYSDYRRQTKIGTFLAEKCFVDYDRTKDVAGRGGGGSRHQGQQHYLYQRDRLCPLYRDVKANEETKDRIALQLMNLVYQPGGRFLTKCDATNLMHVISHEHALKRVKQALRENRKGQSESPNSH
jgi:hypothetical protein